ncbi:MAG: hypothetical protein ABSF34_19530, partial [Verrucomicrobiota bacterium]
MKNSKRTQFKPIYRVLPRWLSPSLPAGPCGTHKELQKYFERIHPHLRIGIDHLSPGRDSRCRMPVNTQIMKFDSTMFYILPATFAPMIAFFIAVFWDRAQRKKSGKPPQTEKLLRPPGHSLALQLDKTIDSVIDSLLASCAFSALAGSCVLSLSYLLAAGAPPRWWAVFVVPLAL